MTSRQPVAVLGATGNQGGHVARALLEAGWPVRAITRHPDSAPAQALKLAGADLAQADMRNIDSLMRAFEGAHGIFSVQNFWDVGLREEIRLGTNVIEAARTSGHAHVVYSSGLGAEQAQGVAAIDGKAILEECLRESGLPYTILRPGLFMEDFRGASLPFPRAIRRVMMTHRSLVGRLFAATLRDVFPSSRRVPLTSLRDVGRFSVWAWGEPEQNLRRTYTVVGDLVKPSLLCATWTALTGERIPHVPLANTGLSLLHPPMATLLRWLGQQDLTLSHAPLGLSTYTEWLSSIVIHP